MRTQSRFLLSLGVAAAATLSFACNGGDDGTDDINNPPPNAVKIDSFTADRTTVAPGGTVTLSYKVSNGTSVSISAAPGGTLLEGSTTLEGQVNSSAITEDTTFTLTAQGTGGPKTQTITVTVDANAVQILTFTANPNPAAVDGTVTLSWTTAGATQVVLSEGATELLNSNTMVASGSFMVENITEGSHTYTLRATNDSGSDETTVTVTTEMEGDISAFKVTPSFFSGSSASVSVTWTAAGTLTLTANGADVPEFTGATTGTISVTVTESTLFELTATGGGFTVFARASVARGVAETEPNNDTASATDASTGGASGMIDPADDLDFFSFSVNAGGNVYAETTDGMGGCAVDTVIRLYDSTGTEIGSNDEAGPGSCSQIDPLFDTFARDLPAGTYYISVESYQGGETGAYTLVILTADGGCGNSYVERSLDEQCDDGNTADGDGCSSTCQVQTSGMVNGIDQDQTFSGSLDPAGKVDYYQVVMDTAGYIEAQTGAPTVGTCAEGNDTILRLYDATFQLIGSNDDINFPDNPCSHIDPAFDGFAAVEAGTYYISVEEFGGNDVIPAYELQIKTLGAGCGNGIIETDGGEQCDDGGTAAGDGCDASCMIEPFGSISGTGGNATLPAGDPNEIPNFVEITVTAGQSITATTTDGAADCPFGTAMGIFTSDIQLLGAAFGDGGCAFIDPLNDARDQWAANLPAGTYLLGVVAEDVANAGQNVTVEVTIADASCGNSIAETEVGEQCDDGGTGNGDGCDSACMFEGNVTVETEPNDDIATANTSGAAMGQTVTVNGHIQPVADHDVWALTVPQGATLIARTYPTYGDPTSCNDEQDTNLFLLDAAGTEVTDNDDWDVTMGYCSEINGTTDVAAANLAAGTYYLSVQHYNDTGTFQNYFMDITLQ